MEGYPVRFASREDVIIHKILAGRPRDLEDVETILRKQKVDTMYIRQWLEAFEDTLGKPLVQSFEGLTEEEDGNERS